MGLRDPLGTQVLSLCVLGARYRATGPNMYPTQFQSCFALILLYLPVLFWDGNVFSVPVYFGIMKLSFYFYTRTLLRFYSKCEKKLRLETLKNARTVETLGEVIIAF